MGGAVGCGSPRVYPLYAGIARVPAGTSAQRPRPRTRRRTRPRNVVGADAPPARDRGRPAGHFLRARVYRAIGALRAARRHDPRRLVRGAPGVVYAARRRAPAAAHASCRPARRGRAHGLGILAPRDRQSSRHPVEPRGRHLPRRHEPCGTERRAARAIRTVRRIDLQSAPSAVAHRRVRPREPGPSARPARHRGRGPHVSADRPRASRGRRGHRRSSDDP